MILSVSGHHTFFLHLTRQTGVGHKECEDVVICRLNPARVRSKVHASKAHSAPKALRELKIPRSKALQHTLSQNYIQHIHNTIHIHNTYTYAGYREAVMPVHRTLTSEYPGVRPETPSVLLDVC